MRLILMLAIAALCACSDEDLTCEERETFARTEVTDAIDQNLSCVTDEDCTLVTPDTDCFGSCAFAVSLGGVSAVQDTIARVNHDHCDGFVADGCAFATPSCLAVVAECDAGACVTVAAP